MCDRQNNMIKGLIKAFFADDIHVLLLMSKGGSLIFRSAQTDLQEHQSTHGESALRHYAVDELARMGGQWFTAGDVRQSCSIFMSKPYYHSHPQPPHQPPSQFADKHHRPSVNTVKPIELHQCHVGSKEVQRPCHDDGKVPQTVRDWRGCCG